MTTNGSRERNWKGDAPVVIDEKKHRWQSESTESPSTKGKVKGQRSGLPILGVAAGVVLTGWLVYLLTYAPVKTPVLAVCAGQYAWPIKLPAWRSEDFSELQKLNGKTIHWVNASREWTTRPAALADLERRVASVAKQAARSGNCVIYLAMQGVVNDASKPCLIPTEGDPLDPTSWIGVDEIADILVSAMPSGVHCLLVIDPIDLKPNWHTGVLSQTFTLRVSEWMNERKASNLSILLAAKDGQDIHASADLSGSLFGREFRLGLSGGADVYEAINRTDVLNQPGDGVVTVLELAKFVSTRVQDWSKEFRQKEQTPLLVSQAPGSTAVARASLADEKTRLLNSIITSNLPTPPVSLEDRSRLWEMYHLLRDQQLYLDNPSRWTEMEVGLLRLEEANRSGAAFGDSLKRTLLAQVSRSLERYVERSKGPKARSIFEREQILANTATPIPRFGPWPSLALKGMFGEIDGPSQDRLQSELPGLIADASLVDTELFGKSAQIAPSGSIWNEVNFVNLLKRFAMAAPSPARSQVEQIAVLHNEMERFVSAADVRVTRIQRPGWETLDRLRRSLEDTALSGQSELLESKMQDLQTALNDVQSNPTGIASLADQAIRTRDLFLVTSPHILAWLDAEHSLRDEVLASPASSELDLSGELVLPGTAAVSSSRLSNRKRAGIDRFLQMLDATKDFTLLLSLEGEGDSDRIERMRDAADLILQDWLFLQTQWTLDAQLALQNRDVGAAILAEVGTELQILIRDKEMRDQLRGMEAEVLESNHESNRNHLVESLKSNWRKNAIPGVNADASVLQTTQNPTGWRPHWEAWGEHPFLTYIQSTYPLLESDPTDGTTDAEQPSEMADRIEKGNRQLRNLFNAFPAFTPNRVATWCRNAGIDLHLQDANESWATAVYADYVERILSPWSSRRTDAHGFALFRNIAIKDLLSWYAQRSLDDFYATKSVEGDAPPFFKVAVEQLLANLAKLSGNSADLDELSTSIQRQLDVRVGSYRQALILDMKTGDEEDAPLSISLRNNRIGLPSGGQWNPELPLGAAGLFQRTSAGDLVSLGRELKLPSGEESISSTLNTPVDSSSGARSEFVAAFRGHEFTKDLNIDRFHIVEDDWVPDRRAEIVLFGDKPKQPSIVFILDCSSSMGGMIPLEAVDARVQSKLDAAKAGILQLLDQLAGFPDARVGVRLFGHRMGWSKPISDSKTGASGPTRLLLQPNYMGAIPDGLTPSRDVENVMPLGRFQPQSISELADLLASVAPWGQSPVYQAVIEAYSDFDADSNSTAKCVVLITDGDNFQFNALRTPGGDREADTTLEDVLRAWEQRQVPTFVLGVGIDRSQESQAWQNLNRIADVTGGQYYDVANRSALLRALMEQLSKGEYRISRSHNSSDIQLDAQRAEAVSKLNSPIQVELGPRGTERFELSFQTIKKEMVLEGGESIELSLRDDGLEIRSEPYSVGSPKIGVMRKANSQERRIARVHRPTVEAGSVLFPISIQNPNSHYTRRPRELWIEIQAQTESKQNIGKPYVFFDKHWKSGVPVPLVDCRAGNWPDRATKAAVKIWFSDEPSTPLLSIPLPELISNPSKFASGVPVPSIPGYRAQFTLQPSESSRTIDSVTVKESNETEVSDINQTKVQFLAAPDALPTKVRHKYDETLKSATHSFHFQGEARLRATQSNAHRIEIYNKGSLTSGAWSLENEEPIEIEIREASDYLPLPINLP